jgi:hypothetical protein
MSAVEAKPPVGRIANEGTLGRQIKLTCNITCLPCAPLSCLSHLQYRHLYKLREALPDVPFMALTATATPKVPPPPSKHALRRPASVMRRSLSAAVHMTPLAAPCTRMRHALLPPVLLLHAAYLQVRADIAANLRLKPDARK